jgi:hypothetical protein
MTDAANAASELEEKSKVIAHLTPTLASTTECLEIARAALECMRMKAARTRVLWDCEIALDTLSRI